MKILEYLIGIFVVVAILGIFGKIYITKSQRVVVREFEKGLFFSRGRLKKVLGSGTHLIRPGYLWQEQIEIIDMRENSFVVNGQEILTKDNIAIKINGLVTYRIIDPKRMRFAIANEAARIYQEVQIQLRDIVNTLSFEELLGVRSELGKKAKEKMQSIMTEYGIEVLAVEAKDFILRPEIREAFSKTLQAKKEAEASLIRAREKVASARALVNAAALVKKNPDILKLKQLEILEQAAQKMGNSFVIHLGETLAKGTYGGPVNSDI